MTALDTSVMVAAFAAWHEFHDLALTACQDDPTVPAHTYMETYSVLTRMPEPFRAPAHVVADYLDQRWREKLIAPSAQLYREMPATLHHAGVSGGATYDALVGLTAAAAGEVLITMDIRARRTYDRLGIRHRLLGR